MAKSKSKNLRLTALEMFLRSAYEFGLPPSPQGLTVSWDGANSCENRRWSIGAIVAKRRSKIWLDFRERESDSVWKPWNQTPQTARIFP